MINKTLSGIMNVISDSLGMTANWLTKPWGITFLVNLLVDLLIYSTQKPIHPFHLGTFGFSLVISVIFWNMWRIMVSIKYKAIKYFVIFSISIFQTLLIIGTYILYYEFKEFITSDMIRFITADPAYLIDYSKTYLLSYYSFYFLAMVLFFVWIWSRPVEVVTRSAFRKIAGFTTLIILLLVGLNNIRYADSENMLTIDTSFLLGVKLVVDAKALKLEKLHTSYYRDKVVPVTPENHANVVLIINESWGKRSLPFYGNVNEAAPFLTDWIHSEKDQFFIFKNAFSNSPATDISMPSILTGVAPHLNNDFLHTAPLLWDWGKAAGYTTIFVSPQRYTWNSFDSFFFSPGPDHKYTALDLDSPIVNDLGVDEIVAVERFIKALDTIDQGEPFLAIYNSNALHAPYQQTSDRLSSQPAFANRYDNGLFILDKAFEKIHHSINERGEMDNTVFIFTGDHAGGLLDEHLPRLYSFYDDSVGVPFLIRAPKSWLDKNQGFAQALEANTNHLVANIDIAPTIAHILGLTAKEKNKNIVSNLSGKSLLQHVPEERVIIALNNNEVKYIKNAGFGIYFGNYRFVYSVIENEGFFDIVADPDEKKNLWSSISVKDKAGIIEIIKSNSVLSKVYQPNIGK